MAKPRTELFSYVSSQVSTFRPYASFQMHIWFGLFWLSYTDLALLLGVAMREILVL